MKITVMPTKSPRPKAKRWSNEAPHATLFKVSSPPLREKHLVPKYGSLVLGTSVTCENPYCTACNSHRGRNLQSALSRLEVVKVANQFSMSSRRHPPKKRSSLSGGGFSFPVHNWHDCSLVLCCIGVPSSELHPA